MPSNKSRGVAVALAIFFGGIGIHKFYLEKPGAGILYMLFCWTLIPSLLAVIEAISMAVMSQEAFDRKYNGA